MRDSDIRQALAAFLLAHHGNDPETLIRHEVGLCAGKRRIDVALVNGELAGYEIKSDEDTLKRLAGQAFAYNQVLDRAILVTTPRHLEEALHTIPSWWGILVARPHEGTACLEEIRQPDLNKQHDAFSLAQFLWREEALEELHLRGHGRGLTKKARHYVWLALVLSVPLEELRAIVRKRLKARPEWPGGQLRVPYGAMPHTTTIR